MERLMNTTAAAVGRIFQLFWGGEGALPERRNKTTKDKRKREDNELGDLFNNFRAVTSHV